MRVPFRLRRIPAREPAVALLLPSHDVEELLALCARLGADPLPRLYHTAAGFLLKLAQPTSTAYPGAVRLRSLSENLFLPVDAELVPALLDDEARGLARQRGLVFLPGGRVLGFSVEEPLPLSALLVPGPRVRRDWQPLPAPRLLAEHIEEILLEVPDESPEEILEAGGEGIGTEAPRPEDSGVPAKVLGQVALQAGKGLRWLGKTLGLRGLANLGAQWMQSALTLAPRLSEALLGRQEAALRELLRDFRMGNLERALRRALPLGEPGDRGAVPYPGAGLPQNDTRYSLDNILDFGRGGWATIWFGGADIQAELIREYRKAAEMAAQKGDYRRAAFIYGKLLRDYRAAANVLQQGGLHHDAAILFLTKVDDPLAAARAFEAAGELDRALQLYRQRGEHVLAGDLLCRAGESDAALVEYRLAADRLATQGDFLAAGELLLKKAERSDLALAFWASGWERRPAANAVPCAVRLAQHYADSDTPQSLLPLVAQAEHYFGPPGNEVAAGTFFNEVARLADRPRLKEVRDELRDRALLGLAGKLRQRAAVEQWPGTLVSDLLGQNPAWAPALVRDAEFALKAATKKPPPTELPTNAEALVSYVTIRTGLVTAACFAPVSGEVFVGFRSGGVSYFRPRQSEVVRLPDNGLPVLSLAASAEGDYLAVLHGREPGRARLLLYKILKDSYLQVVEYGVLFQGQPWVAPIFAQAREYGHFVVCDGGRLRCLGVSPWGGDWLALPSTEADFAGALVFSELKRWRSKIMPSTFTALLFSCGGAWYYATASSAPHAFTLGWTPGLPPGWPLSSSSIAWLQPAPDHLELAGLGPTGTLYWSALQIQGEGVENVTTKAATGDEGYLAATIVRSRLAAGVTRSAIHWLSPAAAGLVARSTTRVSLSGAVACFPSHATHELIVVCRDGQLARVPVPK
jgi:hypothetical protein